MGFWGEWRLDKAQQNGEEVAANVGRREPETRINSLQTTVSLRRLDVNGGEEGTGGFRPPRGHPEATLRLSGGQPVGTRKPP